MPSDTVNLFEIKVPQDLRDFRLDPKGRGTVVYTVHNVTGRTVIARAQLDESDPLVKQRSVMLLNEKSVKVVQVDQEIKGNGEQTFKLSIEMPESAKAQKYVVPKLKFCDATTPDIKDMAPDVSFDLPGRTKGDNHWWWIPIAIAVLVLVGVGLWLWLKPTPPKPATVPPLSGVQLYPDAQNKLQDARLKMHVADAQSKYESVPGAKVDDWTPKEGAKEGDTVTVTLKVPVPKVTGVKKLNEACTTLVQGGLNCKLVSGFLQDQNADPDVINQDPQSGDLPLGQEVKLTVPGPPPPPGQPPPPCHPIALCVHMESVLPKVDRAVTMQHLDHR